MPALFPPAAEGGQGDWEHRVTLLLHYVFRKGRVFLREGFLLPRGEEGRKTSYRQPHYEAVREKIHLPVPAVPSSGQDCRPIHSALSASTGFGAARHPSLPLAEQREWACGVCWLMPCALSEVGQPLPLGECFVRSGSGRHKQLPLLYLRCGLASALLCC